jgi:pimeloyl-ACP methyl ester carboxylesterase
MTGGCPPRTRNDEDRVSFVTVGRENSSVVRIYYEDHGSGPPVVLVHGYALDGHSWEKQEAALLAAGHRVITYDRRGFGASSRPSTGYEGIDRSVFDRMAGCIAADRPAAMKDFMDRSYNIDLLDGSRVSDQAWQNSFYVAISASAHAALRCVTACLEDFRGDLATISIPVLIIHGDQDRVLPYEATSRRLPALLKNTRSVIIAGGPHAVIWTHADEVNQALLRFIGHRA